MEGIIGFGQAECRMEDIPGRRNNQHKERGMVTSRGVGSVRRQACLRGMLWCLVKIKTELGQGRSSAWH